MTSPAFDAPLWLRRELLADGLNDRAIAARVRSGEFQRIRHGAYTAGSFWAGLDAAGQHLLRTRAVVKQSCTDVVVSHTSAAVLQGAPTWGLPLDYVHLTRLDARAGRREAGVRQHRGRVLVGDVDDRWPLPATCPTRAALEVTTLASAEVSLVVINHFLHAGLTSLDRLRRRYEQGIDRWSFTLRTELVLQRANGLCESVGESRLWHFFHDSRLRLPVAQYAVVVAGELIARLDFAWPELGVFVEFDGLTKYRTPYDVRESSSDVVVREKQREDAVREVTGWICVRVTWADLDDPRRLEARLLRAFELAKRRAIA
jgi:hypothetical protein